MSGDVFLGHCWIWLNRSRNMKKDRAMTLSDCTGMMYTVRPACSSSLRPGLCGHLVNLFIYVFVQLLSSFSQAQAPSSLRHAITYFEGEATPDCATWCVSYSRLLDLLGFDCLVLSILMIVLIFMSVSRFLVENSPVFLYLNVALTGKFLDYHVDSVASSRTR